MPDPLPSWFAGYRGAGQGEVTREALAEPWIGPLLGRPRLLVLGLNPGGADLRFQRREGFFADEIRTMGGFTEWAASSPYSRPPWTDLKGANRHHDRRVAFARRFYRDAARRGGDVLALELYPWHSRRVTGAMSASKPLLDRMLWRPLVDLPLVEQLGPGGRSFGSSVASREVRIYRLPSGQRLIASSQAGYAGPPGPEDTRRLRDVLVSS